MKALFWAVGLVLAALAYTRRAAGESAPSPPGDVDQELVRAARRHGVEPWLMLALAEVESGGRHLEPKQDGGSLSYYPLGLKLVAARTVEPDVSAAELEERLRSLRSHADLGARYVAWLSKRYLRPAGGLRADEVLRLAYVRPAAARRLVDHGTMPAWADGPLRRWRAARAKHAPSA